MTRAGHVRTVTAIACLNGCIVPHRIRETPAIQVSSGRWMAGAT